MENVRKHVYFKFVHKWNGRYSAKALIVRPTFHSKAVLDENLVAIQLKKTEITIQKPFYVGMSILDISKTHMYDFHSFMKNMLGETCTLLYTDTDSLIYHVKNIDIYGFIKNNLDKFDTSDYPQNNVYGMPRVNKKRLGFFKDKCNSLPMTKLIVLRSKMYAAVIQGQSPIKKAKSVKTGVAKRELNFKDYEESLFNGQVKTIKQKTIRSRLHVVHTEQQEKVRLPPYDDKRYTVPDSPIFETKPLGHYSISHDVELQLVANRHQRAAVDGIVFQHVANNDEIRSRSQLVFNDVMEFENIPEFDDAWTIENAPEHLSPPPLNRSQHVYDDVAPMRTVPPPTIVPPPYNHKEKYRTIRSSEADVRIIEPEDERPNLEEPQRKKPKYNDPEKLSRKKSKPADNIDLEEPPSKKVKGSPEQNLSQTGVRYFLTHVVLDAYERQGIRRAASKFSNEFQT